MRKHLIAVSAIAFALAVGAGAYSANVKADAASWEGFAITATAVRTQDPSGLRFKTVATNMTPELMAQYPNAECYTTLTFTSSVGGEEKEYRTNVPATIWRPEGDGWNTVLLDIPVSDYATEVTAQSFIKISDTVQYETKTVTSSIGKTASESILAGETSELVKKYVANTVVTLDKETLTLEDGKTATLSATTAPAGYAVKWTSDNEAVAKVDANGVVTAVNGGTANITASVGNQKDTCAVTVSYRDTYDFEDGYVPSFIFNDTAGYSKNGTKSIENYNGSNALKMTGKHTNESFDVSVEYMEWAFANKFAAITFDITLVYEVSNSYISLGYVNQVKSGWERMRSGITDTITITKKMYDEWKTSNLAEDYFRFIWNNSSAYDLTWYIDNFKVQESTLIENFNSFVSRAVYQGGTAPTDVDFVGFYYYSGAGDKFNVYANAGTSPVSHTQQARVYTTANTSLTSATQDGALCLSVSGGGNLYWHIPVSFLDYVFGVDESVDALAYDLACYSKPYGSYTIADFVDYPFTVKSYTVNDGVQTERSSIGGFAYMDYTEVRITRAEWQQMKLDGVDTVMFYTTTNGLKPYTSAVQVMLDNFRFVLAD